MCAQISWGDAARQQPIIEQPNLLSGAGEMMYNMGSSSMSYDHNSMYTPSPAIDEFSQIISQLPPALRNIEPQLLQILVQDEGHIAYILNPMTGEVDPTKLDILRHQLLGSGGGGNMNHQGYSSSASSSMGGGMYQQQRTSSSSNMYSNNNMSMRGGSASGQGLSSSDRYGGNSSMGFDRGGNGRDHENSWDMGHPSSRDRDRDRDRDRSSDQRDSNHRGGGETNSRGDNRLSDRERANEREREQRERDNRERERERDKAPDGRLAPGHGTKASTPCKFFNTRPGCRFGDLCPFGHFKGDDSGSGGGGASTYGPSSRGGPAVRGRGGGRR